MFFKNNLLFLLAILLPLLAFTNGAEAANFDLLKNNETTISEEENPEDFDFNDSSSSGVKEIYDPLEKVNRKIFAFNEFVDIYFFQYVAKGYRNYVPKPARSGIRNFIRNLSLPVSTVNSLMQGDMKNSMASFSSFLINSTLGIGGLFDVAKHKKITYNDEDFGQTFGKYKIGAGPYLVLPFLGPSNVRDGTGVALEKLINPLAFNYFEIGGSRELIESNEAIGLAVLSAIDSREELLDIVDDVRKNSFDKYATIRSAYLQKRSSLINSNK